MIGDIVDNIITLCDIFGTIDADITKLENPGPLVLRNEVDNMIDYTKERSKDFAKAMIERENETDRERQLIMDYRIAEGIYDFSDLK